ncbi:type IV secretory system conjugative DNA transfer family protein [Chloroflexota bacterium]
MKILEARTRALHWEMNVGRGGDRVWPFPVNLEPPYATFQYNRLSSSNVRQTEAAKPLVETLPINRLRIIRVTLGKDDEYNAGLAEQLLIALGSQHPVSFEIVGIKGKVVIQFVASYNDWQSVSRQISSHYLKAQVIQANDVLRQRNQVRLLARGYRLRESPLFQLRVQHSVESYAALTGILTGLEENQLATLQVLFKPVRNPWQVNFLRIACDPWDPKKSAFVDLPNLPKKAQAKIEKPLFAVSLRLAASRSDIVNKLERCFLYQFGTEENSLTPLPGYYSPNAILGRYTSTTGMLLNAEELSCLVHLPDPDNLAEGTIELASATVCAPRTAINQPVFLGFNKHQGKETSVGISQQQLTKHVAILGSTGSGKTTLLSHFLGALNQGYGLVFMDLKGSGAEAFVGLIPDRRVNDTTYLDFGDSDYPPALNVLWVSDEKEREELPAYLVDIFKRLFKESWGQQMERILRQSLRTILAQPEQKTLGDLRRLLIDDSYRKEILTKIEDHDLLRFWRHDFPKLPKIAIFPILNRLSPFLDAPRIRNIICQQESIDFKRMMNSGKILICNLAKGGIGDSEAILLGSYILARLQIAVMGRVRTPGSHLKPFMVIVDEFHNLGGYGSDRYSIESLFAEARQFGVSFVTATQSLSKLRNEIAKELLVNARTLICLNSAFDEAKIVEPELGRFRAEDVTNLKVGQAIVRIERPAESFNLSFPRMKEPVKAIKERIKTESRNSYCRSRIEVESIFKEESKLVVEETAEELKPEERLFLEFVAKNPDTTVTQVYKTLGFGIWKGNRVRESLKAGNLLEEIETRLGKGKTRAKFLVPTFRALRLIGHGNNEGRGGTIHRHVQKLLAELALEQGFSASCEHTIEGGIVDIHLERDNDRIAIEISVVPDIERELSNIRRCLKYGYNKIFCIFLDRNALLEMENKARDTFSDKELTKLIFSSLSKFSGYS